MISIIVPYHREGQAFISECINSIRSTIDVEHEIIIVDDGSDYNPGWIGSTDDSPVIALRHTRNRGVGAAFDTGSARAKYEILVLIGCDIRFDQKDWASNMIVEVNNYPKALTCTSCVNLNAENMDISKRRLVSVVNGATILFFHDQKSNPRMTPTFRGIIEAKWLPIRKDRNIDSYEIPCILGAAYCVSKSWYNHIDGFAGHRLWGTLEPLISLKSYMFGGSCRTAPRIETGHIFKKVGNHGTPQDILIYNKMMTATVLFPDYNRLIQFLGTNAIVERARTMYKENLPQIMIKKMEYEAKTVLPIYEYAQRWGIDIRK